jgi:hypothetical protein
MHPLTALNSAYTVYRSSVRTQHTFDVPSFAKYTAGEDPTQNGTSFGPGLHEWQLSPSAVKRFLEWADPRASHGCKDASFEGDTRFLFFSLFRGVPSFPKRGRGNV